MKSFLGQQPICDAIHSKNLVGFVYKQKYRIVEPRLVGISFTGKYQLRSYQVRGDSSEKLPGWRLFDLDDIKNFEILSDSFSSYRRDYNPNDKDMKQIVCRIE
ncbi:MAG: hypothetical protein WC606_01700 [Candidatus Absconditabacterales bacterium]